MNEGLNPSTIKVTDDYMLSSRDLREISRAVRQANREKSEWNFRNQIKAGCRAAQAKRARNN